MHSVIGHAGRPPRRGPVQRAVYGSSRLLGDVEFMNADFGQHRFAPHAHPVFVVGAVQSGGCRIWHRGVSHLAQPGNLVLMNPGDPHSADPATPVTWQYSAMYFSTATASRWLGRPGTGGAEPRLRGVVVSDADLSLRLAHVCRTLEEDPESLLAEDRFAQFVRDLFDRFGTAAPNPDHGDDTRPAEVALRYLEAHFNQPVRIETLAQLAGRSPYHLIRCFTRTFGMPPYAYLTHLRVARARTLLRAGLPLSDTAFAVGFSDQSHFTRFFRRIVGVPPGVYARGVAGSATAPPTGSEPGPPTCFLGPAAGH